MHIEPGLVSDAKMHPGFVDMCAAVTNPDVRFVVVGGGLLRAWPPCGTGA